MAPICFIEYYHCAWFTINIEHLYIGRGGGAIGQLSCKSFWGMYRQTTYSLIKQETVWSGRALFAIWAFIMNIKAKFWVRYNIPLLSWKDYQRSRYVLISENLELTKDTLSMGVDSLKNSYCPRCVKVSKMVKIGSWYNELSHLNKDTIWKVTKTQENIAHQRA